MWRAQWLVVASFLCCAHLAQAADANRLAQSIDGMLRARLEAERVPPAATADDAEFLRRAYLDLHGTIPTAEQAARFLDDQDPHKRSKLIDELLDSPRYGEHLADIWRKSLISPQVNDNRVNPEQFSAWLAERFNRNDGWDKTVFELVTATGRMDENPAVTYLIEGRFPLSVTDLTDLTSRYFLGVRLNCAQCHDHPFVEWKRSDYWGMAAFFAQMQTPGRAKAVYMAGVQDDPRLTLKVVAGTDMLEGFQLHEPTFLGGKPLGDAGSTPHRVALAQWMTSRENPYFARAAVNRLWWHFFGRGIVNPVDDMHAGNEPSHPELLELLSGEFAASGFDLKFLCRAIMNTQAYGRTSRPGEQAEKEGELFARMSMKVLTAEQLYDSLVQILGPPAKGTGLVTRFGPRNEFSQAFASSGDLEPLKYDRGIPHVLRLMNSPQFAGRNLSSLGRQLERSGRSADENIEHLFLMVLSRRPTAEEWRLAREELAAGSSTAAGYSRIAWALLMTSEFTLNH